VVKAQLDQLNRGVKRVQVVILKNVVSVNPVLICPRMADLVKGNMLVYRESAIRSILPKNTYLISPNKKPIHKRNNTIPL